MVIVELFELLEGNLRSKVLDDFVSLFHGFKNFHIGLSLLDGVCCLLKHHFGAHDLLLFLEHKFLVLKLYKSSLFLL